MKPTVYGTGYLGVGPYKSRHPKGKHTQAYRIWLNMLRRCYNDKYKEYSLYGGRGVTVCAEWHNFQNFAAWYEENSFEGCHLDKDIINSDAKIYSPTTCKCVTAQQNIEKALAKHYVFVSPEGKITPIYNLTKFCREHNLNQSLMTAVLKGRQKTHRGWKLHETN